MDTRGGSGSSNRKLLATGLGLGALMMVALSSRRGRQALSDAADKAAQIGRRASSAAAQGTLRISSTAGGRTTRYGAPHDSGGTLLSASAALQNLADRANELAYGWTSRARRLSQQAKAAADRGTASATRTVRAADDEIGQEMEWVARRVPGRAMLLVATSVGALYAVQRYGLAGRLRRAIASGTGDRGLALPGAAPQRATAAQSGGGADSARIPPGADASALQPGGLPEPSGELPR